MNNDAPECPFYSVLHSKVMSLAFPSSNSSHNTQSAKNSSTFNPSVSEQHGRLGGCSGRESTHSQKKKIKFPQEIIASTGLLPGGGVLCPGSEEVHQAVKLLWQNHEITTSHVSKRLPLEFAELKKRLRESGYIFRVSFEITV